MMLVTGIMEIINGKHMKIIKKDNSWNQNSYNTEFVAVENNYKLHTKQVCF